MRFGFRNGNINFYHLEHVNAKNEREARKEYREANGLKTLHGYEVWKLR